MYLTTEGSDGPSFLNPNVLQLFVCLLFRVYSFQPSYTLFYPLSRNNWTEVFSIPPAGCSKRGSENYPQYAWEDLVQLAGKLQVSDVLLTITHFSLLTITHSFPNPTCSLWLSNFFYNVFYVSLYTVKCKMHFILKKSGKSERANHTTEQKKINRLQGVLCPTSREGGFWAKHSLLEKWWTACVLVYDGFWYFRYFWGNIF